MSMYVSIIWLQIRLPVGTHMAVPLPYRTNRRPLHPRIQPIEQESNYEFTRMYIGTVSLNITYMKSKSQHSVYEK